ncbi:hypothetical protein CDQ84_04260 [Clostridium thermosuccinogenes]|uniref:ABC transporter permease n=1 Tax=Clostridium thermosuccinogenes TaxID=84032 RepID=A0A2K2FJK4_9CLOT|nr:ABC transporter permease [Pseudoclostridium thermosuccinogenes]AUS98367.1 hypothetical protein CDO33_19045 [Pseudoclostridium thermosuccinogenes]PNT90983.1 hypothetical protein CDQ83_14240 [Pseudoclostridium thermosuccinogenes]PNT98953.1 hypothetical protein CDQ85_04215 [Pseudoclostridium thermosuccinogenes]PNU00868.1 hypothetical protein CDQ84_04260 [Pseudoclostridium thermosuccinogenes]
MERFKAAFINEIEKMYKRKKAVVIIVISLITIIFGQLVVIGIRSGLGVRGASSTEFPLLVLSVFANTILPLFTALVTIDTFSGEFSHNTMKIALTKPVSRIKLYSAKVTAIAFFALSNLLVVMVLSVLTGFLFNTASFTGVGLLRIVVSYLVTLVPILVLAIIITFFSNILKSSGAVFFLTILLFISLKALGFIFPRYSSLFITSMIDWYNLWIASSIPLMKLLRQLFIMLGYGIMFFTAGFYLFDKKDL